MEASYRFSIEFLTLQSSPWNLAGDCRDFKKDHRNWANLSQLSKFFKVSAEGTEHIGVGALDHLPDSGRTLSRFPTEACFILVAVSPRVVVGWRTTPGLGWKRHRVSPFSFKRYRWFREAWQAEMCLPGRNHLVFPVKGQRDDLQCKYDNMGAFWEV
jgi:hypothetical protein